MAILKYVALKYGSESMQGGAQSEEKGEAEMLAHAIGDLLKPSNIKCYMPNVDRAQVGDDLIHGMKNLTVSMDARSSTFLMGEEPCFADFMLYELCERVEFISEGKLFEENL